MTVSGLAAVIDVPPLPELVTPTTPDTVVIVRDPVLRISMPPEVSLDAARLVTAVSSVVEPMPPEATSERLAAVMLLLAVAFSASIVPEATIATVPLPAWMPTSLVESSMVTLPVTL